MDLPDAALAAPDFQTKSGSTDEFPVVQCSSPPALPRPHHVPAGGTHLDRRAPSGAHARRAGGHQVPGISRSPRRRGGTPPRKTPGRGTRCHTPRAQFDAAARNPFDVLPPLGSLYCAYAHLGQRPEVELEGAWATPRRAQPVYCRRLQLWLADDFFFFFFLIKRADDF